MLPGFIFYFKLLVIPLARIKDYKSSIFLLGKFSYVKIVNLSLPCEKTSCEYWQTRAVSLMKLMYSHCVSCVPVLSTGIENNAKYLHEQSVHTTTYPFYCETVILGYMYTKSLEIYFPKQEKNISHNTCYKLLWKF